MNFHGPSNERPFRIPPPAGRAVEVWIEQAPAAETPSSVPGMSIRGVAAHVTSERPDRSSGLLLLLDFLPELGCRFVVDRLQCLDGMEDFGIPLGFEIQFQSLERHECDR